MKELNLKCKTKITLEELKKLSPCSIGFRWYSENIKTENIREVLIQLNNHRPDWSRWLMVRLLGGMQKRRLAIFSARVVLHIFEEKYPEDKRVRRCIEAAEGYISGTVSINTLQDSRRAATAAAAAAAYAAATAAAYTAAAAAAAAAAAYADDAAYAGAAVAARKEVQEQIIDEAVRLMGEGE